MVRRGEIWRADLNPTVDEEMQQLRWRRPRK